MKPVAEMTADERTKAMICINAWKRAGPELEKMRREEIRRADTASSIPAFDGLFEQAVREFPPAATSGLVQQQRCFGLTQK